MKKKKKGEKGIQESVDFGSPWGHLRRPLQTAGLPTPGKATKQNHLTLLSLYFSFYLVKQHFSSNYMLTDGFSTSEIWFCINFHINSIVQKFSKSLMNYSHVFLIHGMMMHLCLLAKIKCKYSSCMSITSFSSSLFAFVSNQCPSFCSMCVCLLTQSLIFFYT